MWLIIYGRQLGKGDQFGFFWWQVLSDHNLHENCVLITLSSAQTHPQTPTRMEKHLSAASVPVGDYVLLFEHSQAGRGSSNSFTPSTRCLALILCSVQPDSTISCSADAASRRAELQTNCNMTLHPVAAAACCPALWSTWLHCQRSVMLTSANEDGSDHPTWTPKQCRVGGGQG